MTGLAGETAPPKMMTSLQRHAGTHARESRPLTQPPPAPPKSPTSPRHHSYSNPAQAPGAASVATNSPSSETGVYDNYNVRMRRAKDNRTENGLMSASYSPAHSSDAVQQQQTYRDARQKISRAPAGIHSQYSQGSLHPVILVIRPHITDKNGYFKNIPF